MREVEKIPQKTSQRSVVFLIFLSFFIMGYAVYAPKETAEMIRRAMKLFAETIVPSLFVFSVAAKLFVRSGASGWLAHTPLARLFPLLGVSAGGFSALFLGFLSGFPTGAAILADAVRQNSVTKEEAESLLPFCNNAGMSFVVGAVGLGVFGSARIGMMLFWAQLAAALLAVILTGDGRKPIHSESALPSHAPMSLPAVFTSAVSESAFAMLSVCGYVVFFSVLSGAFSAIFLRFLPSLTGICALFSGFLELSGGVFLLSEEIFSPFLTAVFCGALLGFGGLSVLLQVADRAETVGISLSHYLTGKGMTMLFSAGFAALFFVLSEKQYGIFGMIGVFLLIFCISIVKNKIFFKKTMEKQNGMLYNKN